MTVFVLMGVSGSGKSTLGRRVADELALTFIEGDDFHPQANVDKMSGGVPLTDADRAPWIRALARAINERPPRCDAIVACSALSTFVRDLLRACVVEPLHFVLLSADPATLRERLSTRARHFMRPELLNSQFAALDWPGEAVVVDVSGPLNTACSEIAEHIRRISVGR